MIALPEVCPRCKHKGITYSVGVIRNKRGLQLREYPLVRCKLCADVYFTDLPPIIWAHCGEPDNRVEFTDDPTAIDHSIKLDYGTKYIGGVPVYTVYRP
jgi:hypothetical protein